MSDATLSLESYDRADPDPWLALALDRVLPISQSAKQALLRDNASRSRQFLLPLVRPFARAWIVVAQLIHTAFPRWPHAPKFLHKSIGFGMKRFLSPDANQLILRHFHLGAQIMRFISDNATPGFRPELEPMEPRRIEDVEDLLFLKHDLNIYNFLIQLNAEMERRGTSIEWRGVLDFSAIKEDVELEPLPDGRLNCIDLATAIEVYTPAYALLLTDRDFWRAANSLQLDETIALHVARLTGEEKYLGLVNNRHPLVPMTTLRAGHRLMLHGLATEILHGMLAKMKLQQASDKSEA